MSDMPETIWASRTIIFDDHTGSGSWLEYRHYPAVGEAHEYRRADLPPTLEQALKVPEVAAMVEALRGMIFVLPKRNFYVDNDYPEVVLAARDRARQTAYEALAAIETAMKEEGE